MKEKNPHRIYLIGSIAALGGFLFGFDMAVVSEGYRLLPETKGKSLETIEQQLKKSESTKPVYTK